MSDLFLFFLVIFLLTLMIRPGSIEGYIHRIGRTGRAGARGLAITFFTEKSSKIARELIKILEDAKQFVPQDLIHMSQGHTLY